MSQNENWYRSFFKGAALDLWRQAKSEDETADECDFLQKIFDLPDGAQLLDVPCGAGRLTLPMVQARYKLTGIDYSQEFVDESTKAAKSAKLPMDAVKFIQGDMRKMSFSQQFDGAFCFGNSFGYFDRTGTEQMFNSIGGCLKGGAKLVIDSLMLAETFLVNGAEREWVRVGDMLMLIENQYNARESCVQTDYTFIRNGKEESQRAMHWIYTTGELCSMLSKSNFAVDELFGSLDCEPYELGSDRLLLIARKK